MLTRGELVPGQRLSQSRLARQLGCSPMPVVEAMLRLESDGLLVKQARKQARVRELSQEDLEGLDLLREAIESVTANDDGEAEVAIHRHIAACARCPLLMEELDRFLLIERTAGRSFKPGGERAPHPHSHRALVQAIVDHDADSAEYLMKKHIQGGYETVQRELASRAPKPRKTRRASGWSSGGG